jgi:hypothetical protein
MPILNFNESSAYHRKSGRRFDSIRIFSGQPAKLAGEILKEAETLPPTKRAAVRCILELWGVDGIPTSLSAKEWLPKVQRKAEELDCPIPEYRTTRNARDWIKQVASKLG